MKVRLKGECRGDVCVARPWAGGPDAWETVSKLDISLAIFSGSHYIRVNGKWRGGNESRDQGGLRSGAAFSSVG